MKKLKNPEIIQSIIRLVICLLTYLYILNGIEKGYFSTSYETLTYYTWVYFLYTTINLLSMFWIPASTPRRYAALVFDIVTTTYSSYITGGINSFYVLSYIWIYIGYSTRYGQRYLSAAVILTTLGYSFLLITEESWNLLTVEAIAFILLIVTLPAYLHSLQTRLRLSTQQALADSKAKTEFLSNMTHQIRTPIGGVVGMVDLLSKTQLNMQQQQYLQSLSQSSQSLQEIIDDIVDFAHIESGSLPLNQHYSNPRSLIDSLVHSLAPLGYEKQLDLNCFIDQTFPTNVMIDTQRLRQLLSNLIRYAIGHSTRKGVYINAYAKDNSSSQSLNVSMEISYQQMPGVNQLVSEQLPNTSEALPLRVSCQLTRLMNGLFEIRPKDKNNIQFNLHFSWQQQGEASTQVPDFTENQRVLIYDTDKVSREILEKYCQQFGLKTYATSGHDNLLAHIIWSMEKKQPFEVIILGENQQRINCHELVMRIRKEIKCDSPVLYATYLHSPGHAESDVLQDIQATIIKPISLDILNNTLVKLINTDNEVEKTSAFEQQSVLNILIAEDNEINASVAYSYLTDMGHNVDIATDGTTALYAMHKQQYHLVLMDVYMPNTNGIEVTRQWRSFEKGNPWYTPIVALTAKATMEERERCLNAGMDDFLTKPVNEQQLKKILSTYSEQSLSRAS
ncbi:hypothetical protein MNBD_GAMMA10-1713 [hydrothermal vent metagenome]|uniref:Histidine kinase n=1 Tax=hydrothermal vent metagenome TaxID=652676 RepID=A0A3B0XUE1_9ZZZZ